MTVEAAGFIDDIDPTQPPGTDNFSEGDNHLRNFKKSVQDSFPNISGAMTATHTELNNLDGYTGNTADLNILSGADTAGLTAAELQYVKGVTSDIQNQINAKETYIQSITATVAASALTLGLGSGSLNFRSASFASGATTTNAHAALFLIVPNGATLGTTDTVESDLILLAINNAGTTELAVVNNSGTVSLDEKTLISTTAIGAGSDSADVAYSTTARSNVAFRVIGLIRSTQATAGAWATTPSLLQGWGGNALIGSSLGSLSLKDSIVATDVTDYATGSVLVAESVGVKTGTHTSFTEAKSIYCPTAGTFSVSFDMKATNGGSSVQGRVYVDDVATGTNRSSNSTTYITYTEDITVTAGQKIQIYSTGIGTNYVFIREFNLKATASLYFNVLLD